MSDFGEWGSATHHQRYEEKIEPKSRKKCYCGCNQKMTHRGMANGVALTWGCHLSVKRWVKNGI